MDLSNIEQVLSIVLTVLGILSTISAGYLSFRKIMKKKRKPKLDKPHKEIRPMHENKQNITGKIEQTSTGNSTLTYAPENRYNSDNIENQNNTEITVNFPVSIDKRTTNIHHERQILLNSTYSSLYAENGKLQEELITLNEIGVDGKVSGKIQLLTGSKNEEYLLSATFFNKVINGVYYSSNNSIDECGTINLKQISDDIYSGVCTFSKIGSDGKDVVKSSPYVWVKGKDKNLLCGTYDFCKDCPTQTEMCCCASEKVDMPALLYDEASNLRDKNNFRVKYKINTFAKQIDDSAIYQMRHKKDKKETEPEHCFFFDYENKKCLVYDYRPIDCRLFPFDIRLNNQIRPGQKQNPDNEYWIGYYPGLCNRNLPSKEEMEKRIAILRPYFYLLAPFVESYTRRDIFKRLENEDFEYLCKLRDIIY